MKSCSKIVIDLEACVPPGLSASDTFLKEPVTPIPEDWFTLVGDCKSVKPAGNLLFGCIAGSITTFLFNLQSVQLIHDEVQFPLRASVPLQKEPELLFVSQFHNMLLMLGGVAEY